MRYTAALVIAFAVLASVHAETQDFTGTWESTYGILYLNQTGSSVTGHYEIGGYSSVEGEVGSNGRLVFTYTEPSASGEGWFELDASGDHFSGLWRPDGGTDWYEWEGYRAGLGMAPSNWLVVLEAEWQESMTEDEYSFGEMLDAWFARVPGVTVRHRFVHDVEDLSDFCLESSALPGKVYLVLASHGTYAGIELPGGTVTAQDLISALQPCRNLAMLHFSACEVMAGSVPAALLASRTDWPEDFIVSGYDVSVDWAASGMLEIYYFNQMLENGLSPEDAAQSVLDDIAFAGDEATQWMYAAGFRWLAPGAVVPSLPRDTGRTDRNRNP